MAKEVIESLVDDLDGKPADQTIRYSLDDISYEIDLSDVNAGKLRGALSRYIAVSRRVGSTRGARAPRRGAGSPAQDNRAIREWAVGRGLDVSERGRIPADIVMAYNRAH